DYWLHRGCRRRGAASAEKYWLRCADIGESGHHPRDACATGRSGRRRACAKYQGWNRTHYVSGAEVRRRGRNGHRPIQQRHPFGLQDVCAVSSEAFPRSEERRVGKSDRLREYTFLSFKTISIFI